MSAAAPSTAPVPGGADDGRFESLDVLRGVAVLGILLMNVVGFGLPYGYESPVNSGGADGANLAVWLGEMVLFEGTMRGLFTLLFGAGVLLFAARVEARTPALVADRHARRMLWLGVFGFVNSHLLLWAGDILFEYAVAGLIVVAFRLARVRTLLLVAAGLLALVTLRGLQDWQDLRAIATAGTAAAAAEANGATLSEEQQLDVDAWQARLAELRPDAATMEARVEAMRGGFASAFEVVTQDAFDNRTSWLYLYALPETLAMMLIGVALFRWGALTGQWSRRRYLVLALAGYGLGLPINLLEALASWRSGFDPLISSLSWYVSYELGRVPLTLGHLFMVLFVWKSGWLQGALRRLAATGRMALTHYLAQSALGMLVFTGVGLGLYGQLERYQLYYVVVAIWILQLLSSPWWLARFRYGPVEWLWRALTFGERPPLRRAGAAPA